MTTNDGSIKTFAIKTAIVAGAIVVTLWIAIDRLDAMIDYRIAQITTATSKATKFNPREFWPRLEASFVQAADPSNDMSPERKAKLVEAVRVLRARWDPLLIELLAEPKPQDSALPSK